MKKSTKVFLAIYITLCLVEMVVHAFQPPRLVKALLKILPFIPLMWMMLRAKSKETFMILGLAASMVGDVAVYWGGVLPQIAGFVVAQSLYAFAFSRFFKPDEHKQWRMAYVLVIIVSLMATSIMTGAINNHIPDALLIAITVYMVVIYIMAFFAMSQERKGYALFAIGALLLVISDGLIGVHRFVNPIPYRHYIVMSTYYLGQLLICYYAATGENSD